MSQFDPYHKWLGIPKKDQPPNRYRLLGLEMFEDDPEVIEAAANRQMTYVQGCAEGKYVRESQKLLNEIAQARLCLLDVKRKRVYDDGLRKATSGGQESPSRSVRSTRGRRSDEVSGAVAAPPVATGQSDSSPSVQVSPAKPTKPASNGALPNFEIKQPGGGGRASGASLARRRKSKKAQVPPIVIIGGLVAVALLVVGVAVVLNLPGEEEPEVVSNSSPAASSPASLELPSVVEPPKSEAQSGDGDKTPGSDADAANNPKPEVSVEPPAGPDKPVDDKQPEATEAKPAPKTAQVKPEPVKPKAVKPKPSPVKPAAKPKVTPPKKPEPPSDPFGGFPTVVALPEISDSASPGGMKLGTLHVPSDELLGCNAQLLGSEGAHRGKYKFVARRDTSELGKPPAWTISLSQPASSGSGEVVPIARLTLEGAKNQDLMFQWTPEAADERAAGALCNCLLQLSFNKVVANVALRQPRIIEPLKLDSKVWRAFSQTIRLDDPPDPSAIRVEVARFVGFDKPVYEKPVMAAEKDESWIYLGEAVNAALTFQARTRMIGTALSVTLTPKYKKEMTLEQAKGYFKSAGFMVANGPKQIDQWNKSKQKNTPQVKQMVAKMQANVNLAMNAMADREGLTTQIAALTESGQVHFRLFLSMSNGQQVTLAQTELAAEAKPAPGGKKNAK